MQGTASQPACGFSDRTVALLKAQGIAFTTHDILSDPQAREGLKVLNAWPTFPQLVVHGKLVGGLDILNEMAEDGGEPLAAQLGLPQTVPLETRLKELVNSARVVSGLRLGYHESVLPVASTLPEACR